MIAILEGVGNIPENEEDYDTETDRGDATEDGEGDVVMVDQSSSIKQSPSFHALLRYSPRIR
jgi:hypothetical protein